MHDSTHLDVSQLYDQSAYAPEDIPIDKDDKCTTNALLDAQTTVIDPFRHFQPRSAVLVRRWLAADTF
jgi:hypothetical protein